MHRASCSQPQSQWERPRSVELVHEGVAGVDGVLSGGDPVLEDDWLPERPEGHVDVAEAHTPKVDDPAEEIDVSESFNFLLKRNY